MTQPTSLNTPYVEPVSRENAPEGSKPILEAIHATFDRDLNIFSTLAHQPDVLLGTTKINDGIGEDLDPKLRELAYLHASQLNNCDYCTHYHAAKASKVGVSGAQLKALADWSNSDEFDDEAKAVLAYAEELTQTANVSSETASRVRSRLNDAQMVSLAGTVALANFTNRVNHGLGVQLP
ncbi:MAG: alkyl hydroperoxide reductase AhpD [Planctomycetota bacterium]|nr:MAG: alkyl hydroperoxide reductase AhpD [Planctomycetota bacterium]